MMEEKRPQPEQQPEAPQNERQHDAPEQNAPQPQKAEDEAKNAETNQDAPAVESTPAQNQEEEQPKKQDAPPAGVVSDSAEEKTPQKAEKSKASADEKNSDEEDWSHGEDNEVQGDDEEDEQHSAPEMPNYSEMPAESLVKTAEKLIGDHAPHKLKDHLEAIRKSLLQQLDEEREEKRRHFVEVEGGDAIDFEYHQPLRQRFRELFKLYRSERRKYYQELQKQLEANLQQKQALIEQLKEIVNKEESIGETFREFNDIQQEWNNLGPVPRSESRDLWRTYNHHRDNFYEYIKINKELRDLDYKKNRAAKEELIEKAQALLEQEKVLEAFSELQKLHKQWRRIGPVERENREPMWEKFSEITKGMHARREAFFAQQREKSTEMLAQKRALVQELSELPTEHPSHNQWQKALKQVQDIRDRYKAVGRIHGPENDQVWDEFRAVLRKINHAKNEFYKELKKEQQKNLELKKELIEKAESLKESEDWGATASELKKIQAEWKKIGQVPRRDSDKLWHQFRAACNHFFDRLKNKNAQREEKFEENLSAKQNLLKEIQAWQANLKDKKGSIAQIKKYIGQWKSIGRVPQKEHAAIEKLFNEAVDGLFKAIDMDRAEARRIRFENKMDSLKEKGGDRELQKERSFVKRKLEEAERELAQLETNMSFFSSSDPKSPIVREAQKKIDEQKRSIAALQEQHKMLNIKIRALQQEEKAAQEAMQEGESEKGNE